MNDDAKKIITAVYADRIRIAEWLRSHADTWDDPNAMELERLADKIEDGSYLKNAPPQVETEKAVGIVEFFKALLPVKRKGGQS